MQKVVPAVLTKDPSLLKDQLEALRNHTKWVHIDIMDGRFVPATSISISALGEAYQFFNLEIHLMVKDPERYFEDCKAVGAKRVYFHLEATDHPEKVMEAMSQHPFQKGMALNPNTPNEQATRHLQNIDALLLMSIVPGAQGNEFIPSVLEKIPAMKSAKPDIFLGMDGSMRKDNIQEVFARGVDYVAVGSGIWKTEDPVAALRELQEMVS